jgi:hypothetical protein
VLRETIISSQCAGFFPGISPGPFIGPVEIRGKKIKKNIFLFSLLSTDN